MAHLIDRTRTDDERLEALDQYAVLTDVPGEALQDLVELVAHVCDVPTAAVNILDGEHQHSIVTTGLDPTVCASEDSMCGRVLTEETVVVDDARLDPRFRENAFVDGTLDSVRFYASAPLVTPDGLVLGRLCVFDVEPRTLSGRQQDALRTLAHQVMDVIELRRRGRELEGSLGELTRVRDELHRSNEHLAHFAGQISHDLRSPLTAILATTELLALEPTVAVDDELVSLVDAVSSAGQRMNRMIEEMLGLALQGGRLTERPTRVEEVVRLVLADLAPVVEQSDATIHLQELPTVSADPDMLYSIVLNLLTNALKFTRAGVAPVITVGAEQRGDRWRVRIDDNGPGIDPQRREDVFRPYVRAQESAPGHGIGLATTWRLVDAHGGTCGVDESSTGGASFWFELAR